MSEASVASPQNLTVPKSNSVTSFIEKNKLIIGGIVLLIVLFLLYKTFFRKREKFNSNSEDVHTSVGLEESEQFSPDGVEDNESVNGTEEN